MPVAITFTDGQARSIGVSGKPAARNSMSLTNLLWVRQLLRDGRSTSLENQALVPLRHAGEMGMSPGEAARKLQHDPLYTKLVNQVFGSDTITDEHLVKAIAQFERTLISAGSRYDQYLAGQVSLTDAESRGMDLFI